MRRLISLLFIGIFFLVGCANSPKPESTVSSFIDAGKKFDLAQMAEMVTPTDSNGKEKISDVMKDNGEGSKNQYQKYFIDYCKENAAKITYAVKESKIENDKATVTVDFKYVDGGPVLKATLGDVLSKALSLAFTGVEMNDEDMGQMFVSAMQTQKETVKESFLEKTIDIKLTKVDNQWYIDQPSDELLDVFTSNFVSVGNEINNSMNSSSSNAE
ncbi:hypothetical protein Desor_5177 [Desulfosporosinus orientis DSM 765]|uniref:Uncharacterized protein n=1 Tax=Desulfosporosinus orientis (strain ATCC 19365 / DSM 765 / NCIMB 8382 / VKM B-1628 / Singapore I) TaxID=768706 RepID=G7W757_DESOD|nr:DUF4878 domain-containing protein [Desulfosporosinus orientis]AET70565.1 hypothetical protein Desor_5177 [Desulfosporosinus orientis DSM 765]